MRQFIDLSVALEGNIASDPPGLEPQINYIDHKMGAEHLVAMFPGLSPADLPDGEGWTVEELKIHTHNGTHMDAPWHYASTMNRGEPAITIDQVPLEWCFRPGVKLDFRSVADGHVVTAAELEAEFKRINYELQPFDIVLMNTAAGTAYGQADYINKGCGFGREATLWLLERGVKVVGTDAWSWDAPFSYTRQRFMENKDPSIIWEGHKAGREAGYCQMEKLTNLHLLPATGFLVSCFPYKIKNASAGFTRCVGIIEN